MYYYNHLSVKLGLICVCLTNDCDEIKFNPTVLRKSRTIDFNVNEKS